MPFTQEEKQQWYEFFSKKYGIAVEHLQREYEAELDGKNDMDAPLEIPDKMEVFFKYSLGQQSRFFRELRENKRILGAKCGKCNKTYCPPRSHCHNCYEPTEWVELTGEGTIVSYTVQHYTTSAFISKVPFVCCYIKLDGTDSLLMTNMEMDDVAKCKPGMRVKAVFRDERRGLITDFFFKPEG
ncbi:Zn-ribbon domain-containing OB-fold protein [bacterium]